MKKPKKIYEKVVVQNPYLKVSEKRYEDENGNISSFLITWHNKEKTIWTFVLPITQDWEILYLKEYRYWPEDFVINFPVWMLDDWVDEIENCKRELKEETWYFSEEIEFLWESIIENYFEGKIRYYIAKNCKKIANQDLEVWENICVFKTSISEFEKMILDWKVLSSKTAYCFLLAKLKNMIYDFWVQEPYKSFLISWEKIFEWRLNKWKFKKIKIWDFLKLETWENFLVKNKFSFESFYEMMKNLWFEKIIPNAKNEEEAVNVYYKFYTKEQEKEFGVVAIELEKIEE